MCSTCSLWQLVLPEYLTHIVETFVFLVAGEWFTVLLNAPLLAYNINRYVWEAPCPVKVSEQVKELHPTMQMGATDSKDPSSPSIRTLPLLQAPDMRGGPRNWQRWPPKR